MRILMLHATLVENLPSIARQGLLPTYTTSHFPAVWLAPPSELEWAVSHVMKKHLVHRDQVAVLRVWIERHLVKIGVRGMGFTSRRVDPKYLWLASPAGSRPTRLLEAMPSLADAGDAPRAA